LVKQGVDVNVGGRDGAMLVEIASQRVMNPDPKNAATNQAWAGIIEGGLIDIDAKQGGGRSNRQAWITFSQVARYLGWDGGTLRRYLDGTWRISPPRLVSLEVFLAMTAAQLPPAHD
jgi:hypothetical protein